MNFNEQGTLLSISLPRGQYLEGLLLREFSLAELVEPTTDVEFCAVYFLTHSGNIYNIFYREKGSWLIRHRNNPDKETPFTIFGQKLEFLARASLGQARTTTPISQIVVVKSGIKTGTGVHKTTQLHEAFRVHPWEMWK